MTLAVGVSCPAGAVLATDSMTMRSTADGNVEGFLSAEHKLGQTRDLAWVHSGGAIVGSHLKPAPAVGFVEQARSLYAAIVAAAPQGSAALPVEAGSDPAEIGRLGEQDLIVAGMDGPAASMAMLTKDAEDWSPPEGAIFVAGAPTLWAHQRGLASQPPPATPKGCGDLAIQIAREFIDHVYSGRTLEDFSARGVIPPVAYPLHLLLVTAAGVDRFEWSPC